VANQARTMPSDQAFCFVRLFVVLLCACGPARQHCSVHRVCRVSRPCEDTKQPSQPCDESFGQPGRTVVVVCLDKQGLLFQASRDWSCCSYRLARLLLRKGSLESRQNAAEAWGGECRGSRSGRDPTAGQGDHALGCPIGIWERMDRDRLPGCRVSDAALQAGRAR
jgi:hypothetical protein